jgi:hypothetical protein
MPAGSYKITQADFDANELLIQSADGKYSAFMDFFATWAGQPHKQSDVTFQKYGNVDYLDRIWIEGQRYGMKVGTDLRYRRGLHPHPSDPRHRTDRGHSHCRGYRQWSCFP